MRIGIYKPFKKVFFHNDAEDEAAWSYEVVNVAQIFAQEGHDIYMLSDCDLTEFPLYREKYPKMHVGDIYTDYDRILIFSGSFKLDKHGDKIVELLSKRTDRLDFIFTDYRLLPEICYVDLFDNVYHQATSPLEILMNAKVNQKYGGIAELLPYKFKEGDLFNAQHKDIRYYFGGTERGRIDDYLEYAWRPDCKVTGKSETLRFNNRVKRNEYMALLDRTKYSIVIADVEYNENHFITPRHYENIMHDIVSFVDAKFDPDEHLISKQDFRRVKNYKELIGKMHQLDNNQKLYMSILIHQREEIKPEFIDGSYVYRCLNE